MARSSGWQFRKKLPNPPPPRKAAHSNDWLCADRRRNLPSANSGPPPEPSYAIPTSGRIGPRSTYPGRRANRRPHPANFASWQDSYRINELVRAAQEWQQATAPKYAPPPRLWKTPGSVGQIRADLRNRSEKVHCSSTSLVGRFDAAYGDQSTEGECRLGHVIGLMSSPLSGLGQNLQWISKFARKLVISSLGGEVYALSAMVDRMLLLKDFYGPP